MHAPPSGDPRWIFVICDSFVAMVEAEANSDVIQRLWALTDAADPTVEDLVGAIPLSGDGVSGGVESFAIVRFADTAPIAPDRALTAVVRGGACVDVFSVGGARRFGAGGVEPWMLAGFRSAVAVGMYGTDVPVRSVPVLTPGALAVRHATVVADRVLWAHPSVAVAEEPMRNGTNEFEAAAAVPAASPAPAAAAAPVVPVAPTVSQDDLDRTVLRAEAALIAPPADTLPDDDTILLSRSGTRSAPATRDSSKQDESAHATARFTLSIGSAPARTLTGPVVIGRKPAGSRISVGEPPTLITVASPQEIVSSSHVRVEPQGDTIVVTDLRSTNGTYVSVPGLPRRRIHPGESFAVPGRASIDIGDGNIIEITPTVTDRHSGQPEKAAGGPR